MAEDLERIFLIEFTSHAKTAFNLKSDAYVSSEDLKSTFLGICGSEEKYKDIDIKISHSSKDMSLIGKKEAKAEDYVPKSGDVFTASMICNPSESVDRQFRVSIGKISVI